MIKNLEEQIDLLANEYFAIKNVSNKAKKENIVMDLFNLSVKFGDKFRYNKKYKLTDDNVYDIVSDCIMKYNPSYKDGSSFTHYLSFMFSTQKKQFEREYYKYYDRNDSLNREIKKSEDDKSYELGDKISLDEQLLPQNKVEQNEITTLLLSGLLQMIMDFYNCKDKNIANDDRKRWYSMFYTEDITWTVQSYDIKFFHEREAFDAMRKTYLDFYMEKPCNTLKEIQVTGFKPYQELVPDAKNPENKKIMHINKNGELVFDTEVCRNYLDKIENIKIKKNSGARSNQLKKYKEMKKALSKQLDDNKLQNNPID